MPRPRAAVDLRTHRRLAKELFNRTWDLLGKKRRTRAEDDEMMHTAHASRYHWSVVGRPLNDSIAEWQLSRVYSVLGRAEPAAYHGRRALEIARRYRLAPFYVAYGHEALARAAAVSGNRPARDSELRKAGRLVARIRSRDDRRMLEDDLATVP
jgi:hypothetical protein